MREYNFSMKKRLLLMEMKKAGIIRIGELTKLKDGSFSPVYIDMRDKLTDDHPEFLLRIGNLFADKITEHLPFKPFIPARQVIIGVPDAGHPLAIATAIAAVERGQNFSCLVQRKDPKTHGRAGQKNKLIIGRPKAGRDYILIDDVITTSKSKRESIAVMKREGFCAPNKIIVFFDREQGGRKSLERDGYEFHAVFKLTEVLGFFLDEKKITENQYRRTLEFIEDNQFE